MITGQLRSQIDQLWLRFHSGGITNPLTVIEQISFLMFARMLDLTESRNESRAARLAACRTWLRTIYRPICRQMRIVVRTCLGNLDSRNRMRRFRYFVARTAISAARKG